jgi:hypothetical protein
MVGSLPFRSSLVWSIRCSSIGSAPSALHCRPRRCVQMAPVRQYRYATIHSLPSGSVEGNGKSASEIR